jgi:hypothetical protein
VISSKQFGFLANCQIHDVVRIAQEGLHTIKTKKLFTMFRKLDLSKAFDREN